MRRYKEKIGNNNFIPPIDLKILKEIISDMEDREIILEPLRTKNPGTEAILIPFSKKFTIKTKNDNWEKIKSYRERMSISHEFAHILYYGTKLYYDESKCFKVARELLVPKEMLENDGNLSSFTKRPLQSFKELCENYKVSAEIMACRLTTDTSIFKDIIITFWFHKNNFSKRNFSPEDFKFPRSFLSHELTKSFYQYWRRKLYKKTWEKLEENYNEKEINGENTELGTRKKKSCTLYITKWPLGQKAFNITSITKVKK